MKKRIALLLVLVLALSFVLASCGEKACETCTDANEDGVCDVCGGVVPFADITALNLYEYDGSDKDPASISKVVTFEFKGEPKYQYGNLLITREEDTVKHDKTPALKEDDEFYTEHTYVWHVYDLATGKQVNEYTQRPNWNSVPSSCYPNYDETTNTKIRNIEFSYSEYGYVVVNASLYNSKKNVTVYSDAGVELANVTAADVSNVSKQYQFFSEDHFVFMDVLYRIEADGTKTTVVDTKITDLYNRYYYQDYDFYYMNGKYYAVRCWDREIYNVTVFDGNFNFLKFVDIPDRFDTYAYTYLLANGNVFVRYEKEVEVDKLLPTDTYDYVDDGYAYSYDDVIVNTETGEVTDIEDLPFVDFEIYAVNEMAYGSLKIKEGVTLENMIWGYEVVDGVISGESSTYYLTNAGTLKNKFVGFDGFDEDEIQTVWALSADALVFKTPAGTYLYKADGTKVGMFPGSFYDAVINDKYIKYGNDIYDFSLTKVFTIDKDMKNVKFANDAIYYAKYTKQIDEDYSTEAKEYVDGYYTWYVWNGANKELVKIYDDDAYLDRTGFYAWDNGYAIISYTKAVEDDTATPDVDETAAAKYTYTFYASTGVKVDEIVLTETTTTADGKTTVVENAIEDANEGSYLFYVIEEIETTVTQGSNSKTTETYKIHVFW